jgi:hypothetical protein
MANAAAVLVFETSKPIPFTVSDAAAIEKGDFLQLSDPFTVSLTSAADQKVIGIAAEEKIANDGKVKIGVYMTGIFKVEAGANCTVGYEAVLFAKNEVEDYDTLDAEVGKKCGRFLETGVNGEFVLMALNTL